MSILISLAEGFIALFQKAGDQFMAMASGSIPMLITLLTVIHFLIKAIGTERINRFAQFLGGNSILAYGILPTFAWFFFSSPGALTVGKFLPEKCKPGFEDALGTSVHPLTSLFPHIVPGELFIWLGVAAGVTQLGLPVGDLAIRYIALGVVLGLARGIITEKLYLFLSKRGKTAQGHES